MPQNPKTAGPVFLEPTAAHPRLTQQAAVLLPDLVEVRHAGHRRGRRELEAHVRQAGREQDRQLFGVGAQTKRGRVHASVWCASRKSRVASRESRTEERRDPEHWAVSLGRSVVHSVQAMHSGLRRPMKRMVRLDLAPFSECVG